MILRSGGLERLFGKLLPSGDGVNGLLTSLQLSPPRERQVEEVEHVKRVDDGSDLDVRMFGGIRVIRKRHIGASVLYFCVWEIRFWNAIKVDLIVVWLRTWSAWVTLIIGLWDIDIL